MGTPNISVKSQLAGVLAKTLNTTPEKLDKMDGKKDGNIRIRGLELPNVVEADLGTGCWITILVDNGDGKIGKGDLFLAGHPPYLKKADTYNYEFRFAKLFEQRKVQQKGKYSNEDPNLPFESHRLLKVIESHKGRPYDKNLLSAIKKVCKNQ